MKHSAPGAPTPRDGCRRRSTSPAATVFCQRRRMSSRPAPTRRRARRAADPEDFPADASGQFVSERGSLSQLRGRLVCRSPRSCVEGERDGWPYLVITRLPGVLGADAWPRCQRRRRSACLRRSARPLREVQRAPPGALADRAALGRVSCAGRSRVPGTARAARPAAKISGWAGRSAARCRRPDPDGRAAGDPDRRIYSGEFLAEPRGRRWRSPG